MFRGGGFGGFLFAILSRRETRDFGEEAGEVAAVLDADLEAYLIDFHVGLLEHKGGLLHLEQVEVLQGAVLSLLLEEGGEMGGGITSIFCHLLDGEFLLDVLLHIVDGSLHDIGIFVRVMTLGMTEQMEVAHGGQVVVE